jgi:uncharacterized membrane protein
MLSLYLVLKFVHILSAIVAVGANITYGFWSVRSQRDPAHLGFVIKSIKALDDRIANPAYGVLFLTGILLIITGHWSVTSLWIIVAVILFVAVFAIGIGVYSPLLKNQIKLLDAGDATSAEFVRLRRMNVIIGPLLGLIVVIILAMMVFKPTI